MRTSLPVTILLAAATIAGGQTVDLPNSTPTPHTDTFNESEFLLSGPDVGCATSHHHAANGGFVTSLDNHTIPDPDPFGCGFGLLTFSNEGGGAGGGDGGQAVIGDGVIQGDQGKGGGGGGGAGGGFGLFARQAEQGQQAIQFVFDDTLARVGRGAVLDSMPSITIGARDAFGNLPPTPPSTRHREESCCCNDFTDIFVDELRLVREREGPLQLDQLSYGQQMDFFEKNGGNIDFMGVNRGCASGCPNAVVKLGPYYVRQNTTNDILYGFMFGLANGSTLMMAAGGYYWDFVARGAIDPSFSQNAYDVGHRMGLRARTGQPVTEEMLMEELKRDPIQFNDIVLEHSDQHCDAPHAPVDPLSIKAFSTANWIHPTMGVIPPPPSLGQ